MMLLPPNRRVAAKVGMRLPGLALLVSMFCALAALGYPIAAQERADLSFSPASGHARVIAQGVVALPEGDAVWRTVRTKAPLPGEAAFAERPLGFVLATTGPLLLVDQVSGAQMQLGIGEAALTRAGSLLMLSSLAAQAVSYLSIELVSVNAAPPPAEATVLQPGQPFVAPSGLHDLDLLSDTLLEGDTFTIPDSGAKNVVLITDGAASVGRPGGDSVVLLAGEAASFSGELEISLALDGASATGTSFVVAMIGPEIPPVDIATAEAAASAEPTAAAQSSPRAAGGSITIQIYTCPPGMTAETLNAAACAPATEDVDVTLSGAGLASPLTLADATASGDTFTWTDLSLGDFVIAEAVLPSGFNSYILAARQTSGSPEAGYRVSIDPAEPNLAVRIYNFS